MRRAMAALVAGLALATAAPAAAQAQEFCDPITTAPNLRGEVPAPSDVIGIELGERDVTTAESDAYLAAVDRASNRVTSGTLATSVQGRPLRYAIVGQPARVRAAGLARIRANIARLRDPATPPARAARLADRTPAVLWIAGNVHGGEESGTDASLRVLRELADRADCAARQVLEEAIVVILPVQNPDGREADTRQNAYGFDMNRDWFARTQPETDGKIEFMRRYPPQLFIDAHEMGNLGGFFFPPNADPIYHDISSTPVSWINDLYGRALQNEFRRQEIPFFNYSIYDLFYMGYGDTVPSTGFTAAGMTFEKTSSHPTPRRVYEQYVAQWVSLAQAVRDKDGILARWHAAHVEARDQGVAGVLEPNEVVQPENTVQREVPDLTVRHYFIRADDPDKARETRALVRRLVRMDVEVRRLNAPLSVPDFKPYGRAAREVELPAGTYWVPMAQGQKHWVQAMLNEDTYTPFPYFYDVTAWSQPLLFNVEGGFSGAELEARGQLVRTTADPGEPAIPQTQPRIGIYQLGTGTSARESSGWLRYLLDRWGLRHRTLTGADLAAGRLADVDVLLAPNGDADAAMTALGDAGAEALRTWLNAGGRLVAWKGGAAVAARTGLTLATFSPLTSELPGSLLRVRVEDGPLGAGVGALAWAFYEGQEAMRHPDPARVAVAVPPAGTEDFFVSGFAQAPEELAETAAVVDEPVGRGRSVIFAFEPNFRAFTHGTQKLLRNAILGAAPTQSGAVAARAGSRARAAAERRARRAAERLPAGGSPLRLVVAARGEASARRVLGRFGLTATVVRGNGRAAFTIANPGELVGDEHPTARPLAAALRRERVPVLAFRAP